MKYKKLITNCLAYKSNHSAHVAVAVVAGLAAGAVISILFAPDKGSNTRKGIASKAKDLSEGIGSAYTSLKDKVVGQVEDASEMVETEIPHFVSKVEKKSKSAIKDLKKIADDGEHTEQALG